MTISAGTVLFLVSVCFSCLCWVSQLNDESKKVEVIQLADLTGATLHLEQLRMATAEIEPLGVRPVRKTHRRHAAFRIEQDIVVENRRRGARLGVGAGARSDQALL